MIISSFVIRLLKTVGLPCAACAICLAVQPAAAGTPSIAELQQTIAALEKRVAALEAQVQQRSVIADQGQQSSQPSASPVLVSLAEESQSSPMQLGQPEKAIELAPSEPAFSGIYLGASFGAGVSSSKSRYRDTFTSSNHDTDIDHDTDLNNDGTLSFSESVSSFSEDDQQTTTGKSLVSHHIGALEDLYLGAGFYPTSRVLLGVQVEGSLAEMSFDTRFRQQNSTFAQTSTDTSTETSTNGSSSQSSHSDSSQGSEVSHFPFTAQAKLDWMTSVIGRAGWLATPTTLVYGLGGWNYGHFELDSYELGLGKIDDYGAQGFTVGGGIERKLSRNWSMRAEYRYISFGDKRFSVHDRSTDSRSESGPSQDSSSSVFNGQTFASSSAGTSSESSQNVDTSSAVGHIEGEMQIGRIGFTRYFGGGS